jgi:hypothetical protein
VSRQTRRRAVVAALMISVGVSACAPSGARPRDTGPTLEGPNVVRYEPPLYQRVEFEESYRIIRQGERRPDGSCTFERSTTLRPTDPPRKQVVIEVELAFDPDTCRSLVEIGTPKRS